MKRLAGNKIITILLAILILVLGGLGGCQQAAKKPAPPLKSKDTPLPAKKPLSPEVTKYKSEPTISLYRSATGAKDYLKLEEYIKGVVAAEIGPKYPMEALKAQAIVARTMTLALINYENGTRGKHNTDASDDHTEFQ
ncbi:MAG TPA: SpoIID/LytB domain-containing protein, partial [Clostridia bacterium]|nr:SpoIID/LytB domain-containing protein [Clostridia bacterium]